MFLSCLTNVATACNDNSDFFVPYYRIHDELITKRVGQGIPLKKQDSVVGAEVQVVEDEEEGEGDNVTTLGRSSLQSFPASLTDPVAEAVAAVSSSGGSSSIDGKVKRVQSESGMISRPSFVLKHLIDSNVIQDELNKQSEMTKDSASPVYMYLNKLKEGSIPSPEASKFRVRRLTYAQKTVESPEPVAPLTRKRTTIYTSREPDETEGKVSKLGRGLIERKKPPFSSDILGTYSQHGVEPSSRSYEDEEKGTADEDFIATVDKINQDRGCVCYPLRNDRTDEALLLVLDGHGEHGDKVSEFVMREIVKSMETSEVLRTDPPSALTEAFVKSHGSLLIKGSEIQSMTSGTTCAAVYFKGDDFWTAHAGDSRVVVATDVGEMIPTARSLTSDHKPDEENERKRIEEWGGFVSPAPEPGVSARVWLDPNFTMIGLAMSRSLGDYAVTAVGVIPQPDVTQYKVEEGDKFMILASDGVWEFIESQEAVEIVHLNMDKGAEEACKVLIDTATERWQEEEGDYRDDITAIVVKLPLPMMG